MEILLALDVTNEHPNVQTPAESMLKRLRFASTPRVDAVHVIPPPAYTVYETEAYISADIVNALETAERDRSTTMVESAAARFAGTSYPCRTSVQQGNVVPCLQKRALETGADLIAINGSTRGIAAAFLQGSVVRSLVADAKCSLLIAKQCPACAAGEKSSEQDHHKPLNVVFATDHSDYIENCVNRFVSFAPRGIGRLTIVTAYPKEKLQSLNTHRAHLGVPLDGAVEDAIVRRNAALTATFHQTLCSEIEYASRVVDGDPGDAIATVMAETAADLLVLGARGHGFVERLTLGSVSYKQAVATPYSVLILRY